MDNYASLEDNALLEAVYQSSQEWVKMQHELERRFTERNTKTIETETYEAKQRTDTEKYEFTKAKLDLLIGDARDGSGLTPEGVDSARQISRPYCYVTKKEGSEVPF